MPPLKEEILQGIYTAFDQWSANLPFACARHCSACCTQNVTMTAVEGEVIHRLIHQQGHESWFAGQLLRKGATRRPRLTTNDFAAACLQGEEIQLDSHGNSSPCPFLEESCCRIYEARPFACRCFASEQRCFSDSSALVPDYYLSASMAVMQIIEHLGQGEYWGNMLDILSALCDLPENRQYGSLLPSSFTDQARVQLIKARPLPGFFLLEEEMAQVGPLLEAIFSRQIGEKTVEAILNNR